MNGPGSVQSIRPVASKVLAGLFASLGIVLAVALTGCAKERSFTFRQSERVEPTASLTSPPDSVRSWLRTTHQWLEHLLPWDDDPALLTEDLVDANGNPVDVLRLHGRRERHLSTIVCNLYGMLHTAQATGAEEAIDSEAAPWPGFEDIRIPIDDTHWLNARFAYARDAEGRPREASCIVLLPGLLGDLAVRRSRDMAMALLEAGHHVCALELRGFGQNERHQPDLAYTFGALETGDLLAVDEWLRSDQHVTECGLIGFCWSGNQALLVAWEDGRSDVDPDVPPRLQALQRPRDRSQRHFTAGVIAFSPTIAFEEVVEQLDEREWSFWRNPALRALQEGVRERKVRKGYPETNGSLRTLIEYEFARSPLNYPGAVDDGYRYLRLLPHGDLPAGPKLDHARIPTLIVHGSNDILADARDVARLIARTSNPNVAAVVLDGGGHVGFAAYSRRYFYNLFLGFFDERHGAAAAVRGLPSGSAVDWVAVSGHFIDEAHP